MFAAVNDAVTTILSHARSDGVKADEIVSGIMGHGLMQGHLTSLVTSKAEKLHQRMSDDVIDELLTSINKLKNGARNTAEWVAYRCILNAIVPEKYANPKLMANFLGAHYHTIVKTSVRKANINETGDWSIGTLADIRRDCFALKYPKHVTAIESFYESETQASPSEMKPKHIPGNHRNKNHHRVCIDESLCKTHAKHFQTCTDKTMYERFAAEHADIAKVCSRGIFKGFRPWWVVAPTPRTCVCIHCSNFYMKHDAFIKAHADLNCTEGGGTGGEIICAEMDEAGIEDPTARALKSADDVAARLFCDKGDSKYHNVACVDGDCGSCGWDAKAFECGMCEDQKTQVEWHVQKNVPVSQANDAAALEAADAYGEYQGEKTVLQKIAQHGTLDEFMAEYKSECRSFFSHRELHHSQADAFTDCVDYLPVHHMALLIDYNMNHSHNHPDSTQGEHWSHMQTTLVPVIIYVRDEKGVVNAISEVVLSEDLDHSNQMIQHIIKKMVVKYKHMDPYLSHCHIWSDGCAGQLKNRWQMWFLSQRFMGLSYSHNFFASCHG